MSRDEGTFETFFREVRPALTGQAWLMTGDLAEAHDLAQEVLCRAWANWERLESYEDPAGWAGRVLHNLVIGRWRRSVRRRGGATTSRTEGAASGVELVAEHVDLVRALQELPAKQRKALVLRDFVGLTTAQVAVQLAVPEGTVKSWVSRGRAAVAQRLGLPEAADRGGR